MLKRGTHLERSTLTDTIWYYVVGELGAVQLLFLRQRRTKAMIPIDLSVHSRRPLYANHQGMDNCDLLDARCYYSGSSALAKDLLDDFWRKQDPEFLWRELEEHYGAVF